MTNCSGCPFLYDSSTNIVDVGCSLGFVNYLDKHDENPHSYDCQLEVVQWSRKDKPDSETFKPKRDNL